MFKLAFIASVRKALISCGTLLAVALLGACAQFPGSESPINGHDKSKGVVAASVTYATGTRTMNAWFYIRKKGEADRRQAIRLAAKPLFAMGGGSGLSGSFRTIDFPDTPDREGRVQAVPLEPGEYELYTWVLDIQVVGGYGSISPKVPPTPIPFVISPGSVTYLGSLHGQTIMGKNLFGMDVPGSGTTDITDKSERDIPMLLDKYPMLNGWPVDNVRLNGQAWLQP